RLLVRAAEGDAVNALRARDRPEELAVRRKDVDGRAGGNVEAPFAVDRRAVAAPPAAKPPALAPGRERTVGLDVEREHDLAVRDVERRLVRAQHDAVRGRDPLAVLRDLALRVRVEKPRSGDREIDAAASVGGEVVQHTADALERLAAKR